MRMLLIAAAALLGAAGCSASENIGAAEREVERFHRLAAEGQADRLYEQATEDFKRMASARDFRDLLEVVNERLGDVRSANRQGWHVNYAPGGAVVTLTYDTQFERGRGVEQFVYRLEDERALLLGYHINSNSLIARPSDRDGEENRPQAPEPDEQADSENVVEITAVPRH